MNMLTRNLNFVLACCAFVIVSSCAEAAQEKLADVIERCEKSVIKIRVSGRDGESIGSGFVVGSNGLFVTNFHVLGEADEAVATFANGKSYRIKGTYYVDRSRDICVAQLEGGKDFTPIKVNDYRVRKGESVVALGSPLGLDFTATTGIVSAVRDGSSLSQKLDGTWIQVDAALSSGNSGGPLIDEKGVVIGMSTLASIGDTQNLNFGVSARDILDSMNTAKGKKLIPLNRSFGSIAGGSKRAEDEFYDLPPDEDDIPKERPDVPSSVIFRYVEACKADYEKLVKSAARRADQRERYCRVMIHGKVAPLSNGGISYERDRHGELTNVVYDNDALKEAQVRLAREERKMIALYRDQISDKYSDESLLAALRFSGLPVDAGQDQSVGLIQGGMKAISIPGNHVVVGVLDTDVEYSIWMSNTDNLAANTLISPLTVYVARAPKKNAARRDPLSPDSAQGGKARYKLTRGVLVHIEQHELEEAVRSQSESEDTEEFLGNATRKLRTWTAGKHGVTAEAVSWDGDSVTLKKGNGKTVKVKRALLSKIDNAYLDNVEKSEGNK